jgi:hypothetical protein
VGIKIQSEVVAGFIAVGLAMAAYGVIPVSATDSCEKPAACLVSGAEVDDPLTAQARKVIGSGPSVGLAADQRMKADLAECSRTA